MYTSRNLIIHDIILTCIFQLPLKNEKFICNIFLIFSQLKIAIETIHIVVSLQHKTQKNIYRYIPHLTTHIIQINFQ